MSYKLHWQDFPLNQKGRDFAVGDIHGYFDMLRELMKKVNFNPEIDRLFSVGDNIDRGPKSHEVLEWFDKPWFFSIAGNHEIMAIGYHKHNEYKQYGVHGGQWFIDLNKEERDVYVRAFEKLPLVFEVQTINGTVGIVHGECNPNDWWEFKFKFDDHKDSALWGFGKFYKNFTNVPEKIENILYVIHGHNNVKSPSRAANTIYIDTGKLMGKLTLLEFNHPDGLIAHN